ncbi:MAG TPA: hypothetical protein VGI16_04575, partial [Candidatus Acidoferrum sp.]
AWAPQPTVDADYAQFVRDTGFDYERDIDRISIAVMKHGPDSTFFVIADGRFDQRKINGYALQSGSKQNSGGHEIFTVPLNGNPRKISYTFLGKGRIAITDDANLFALLSSPRKGAEAEQWQERFDRLAGSPVFVVIQQDAGTGSALATQAPGGMSSPQLSALLDQLQWITLAGKPEGDRLHVVIEGESATEATVRQLETLLSGLLTLAQAGLNGPQVRGQLDSSERDAYLEMLKSAEVSRIGRGETKSIKLVFDVTPKFLDAARMSSPVVPEPQTPQNKAPARAVRRK